VSCTPPPVWLCFVTAVADPITPWLLCSGSLIGGVLLLAAVVWRWHGVRRSLTLGALLLVVASGLCGALLEHVLLQEFLLGLDSQVAQWLHAHATPCVTTAMLTISALGSGRAVTVIALGLALFWVWHRAWERLLVVALTVPGGALLNALLKHAFRRARPLFDDPLLVLTTYSFPSGHAMAATVLYGLLAVSAMRHLRQGRSRMLVASVAGVVIVLVSFSRLYLGVHYLSDVLGGMAVGVVWLLMCLTAVESVRRQHGRLWP